jgi:hypothetical protein
VITGMYGEAVGRLAGSVHIIYVGGQLQTARINKGDLMIKNLGKMCLTLCLLMVFGGVVANAQMDSVPQVEVNITFPFMVGDTKLPAGKYVIKTSDDNSPNVLELRSADTKTSVIFDTENAQARGDKTANKTELVFDKVGDQYFLRQIWVGGTATGNELTESRMEKRLTGSGSQAEKHSVVASMKRMKP